ncbi:P-loop containing nucleoside triphosphate hydrolase protein [Syncephalastrum racemosum]|uniref:P-loop containing nucleoside triphosphate hydrolase protein n=1 Tax=Syncephalastrum racemosum TaxID=13706 RepID=A0A1X2HVR2_SYNRA|nr:P-loop containing nucleoside triphosphate hydrolase protein [Syncephalastrum racemosum]
MADAFLSSCYGDEGARLAQLFSIAFCNSPSAIPVTTILLTGDTGTGKSAAIARLASEHDLQIFEANLGTLAAEHEGQLGKGFEKLVWKAIENEKSVVVIDDLDLFCPQKGETQESGFELALRQCLARHPSLVMVATSRHPSTIASQVRVLFQDEIAFQIPTPAERLALLNDMATKLQDADVDWDRVNRQAHGFVAADLARWCRLAQERAFEQDHSISTADFEATRHRMRVSALQSYAAAEMPEPVRWTDIGGLDEAKRALEESTVWVYRHANAYQRLGVTPPKGVLLYGPPGTGKTMLAKAVATESSANFMAISIPDLIKSHVGESEKAVVSIFDTARRCSPCVVFFDELEAIFSSRETAGDTGKKLISQFLLETDKAEPGVILLGATNHPDAIDPSILRPGRLDRLVYVGPPSEPERRAILDILGKQTKLGAVDLNTVAAKTAGCTGADLRAIIRKAGLLALKRIDLTMEQPALAIEQQDLDAAMCEVLPYLKEAA